jgi:Phage integrase family
MAGLRRNEIDKLPWTAIRFDEGVIRIEATQFYRPKSHESKGEVLVEPELMEVLRGYHARATGAFVIESDGEPNPSSAYGEYRCRLHFLALIAWLRAHGVVSRTPLHSLRKEFGSLINARYGVVAAQQMLRHSDIKTTVNHYVENKHRSVLGFGHLLKGERIIIAMDGAMDDVPGNGVMSDVTGQIAALRRMTVANGCTEGEAATAASKLQLLLKRGRDLTPADKERFKEIRERYRSLAERHKRERDAIEEEMSRLLTKYPRLYHGEPERQSIPG